MEETVVRGKLCTTLDLGFYHELSYAAYASIVDGGARLVITNTMLAQIEVRNPGYG